MFQDGKHEHSLGDDNQPLDVAHLNDNMYQVMIFSKLMRVQTTLLLPGND